MGDAATIIVDRLISPSGCLAGATGVIREAFHFTPGQAESENQRATLQSIPTEPIDRLSIFNFYRN